jgi:hypothetical protein
MFSLLILYIITGLEHRWFESRQGPGIFLFIIASRTALGSTQPPIQWVPGGLSLGVKQPQYEADHSPPSSAEVKNAWSYTSTPQYATMAWCSVKKKKPSDNLTFLTLIYVTLKNIISLSCNFFCKGTHI